MNNNFSKLGKQLLDIWSQLGASQRVSVIAATFILVAGLTATALWSSRADYSLLYGGLSEAEAAKVASALDEAKVTYKINGSGSISVPADKVYQMRMQLAAKGIPQGEGVGFEIFDKPNFGISDFVQRANYLRALQGELSRTISQLDEIQSSRVMIVLPENRLLLDKEKYPTASVFVHVRGNSQLSPSSINSIRFLVANSVEGLKPNHVSVVDNMGNVLSENTDNDSLSGMTGTQLQARRNLEQYLSKKAQEMLEKVLGVGQAIVRVSAEVNYDSVTKSEQKFDPDGQVISSQTKTDDLVDTATTQNNSPAGISANTPQDTNGPAASAGAINKSKNSKTVSEVRYEISSVKTDSVQIAGGIKRLTAAITVAQQMQGTGADRKAVPRDSDEIEKIRTLVSSALGIDASRGDKIEVAELPFNDTFATDLTQTLDSQQKKDFWMTLATNLMYPGLGVGALLLLLRLFRQTPVQEIPMGIPVGRLTQTATLENEKPKKSNYNFDVQPNVVTVEVLNRLIKDNPTNMTSAIRDWMNRGRPTEATARNE